MGDSTTTSAQLSKIKRSRERLACAECRRRKLRCDRNHPCGACVRRGGGDASCSYQRFANGGAEPGHDHRMRLEERLGDLELLLGRLVTPAGADGLEPAMTGELPVQMLATSAQSPSLYSDARLTDGAMGAPSVNSSILSGDQVVYGPTHWMAVWKDIQDLRLAINGHDVEAYPEAEGIIKNMPDQPTGDPTSAIFGSTGAWTLDDILAAYLPPRSEADRHVAAYFRAQAIAAPFIHAAHFNRLYQAFWEDPAAAPPLWVSLVFSICHVSTTVLARGARAGQVTDTRFSTAAAHCLALGEYFRPKQFAVEALLLYVHAQCLTSVVLTPDIVVILGVVARTATLMGYHRDPALLGLSPFEAEMRRRVWMLCVQLDLMVSFHLGVPGALRPSVSDWTYPLSLSDSDFDESSTELPPARPDIEITGISFCLAKQKFMGIFDKVLQHALADEHGSTEMEQVDALGKEANAAFASLPAIFHPRSPRESVFDSPTLVVTRLCVRFIYCKCICVLHRPHVAQRRPESVRACYDATSGLMGDFMDAYAELAPEGQTESEGWFVSSLTWHDFLLGLVTLCLVVIADGRRTAAEDAIVDVGASIELLSRARSICVETALMRGEKTKRMHMLIDATVQRLGDGSSGGSSSSQTPASSRNGQVDPLQLQLDHDKSTAGGSDSLWDGFLEQYLDFAGADPAILY